MITRPLKLFMIFTVCGLFAASVTAGMVAQQQAEPAASAPTASNQFAILVTTIAGFASMLAAQFFQFYRENRNRKWDLADRMHAREESKRVAETQRLETIQTAIELARASNINREHVLDAIKDNTQLTAIAAGKADAAFVSANNFNEKLEALHQELVNLGVRPKDAKEN